MSDLSLGLLNQGLRSSRSKEPKTIALSATSVPESTAIGSAIAMMSTDGSAPVSFAITADPDGKFALRGDWLLLAAALDYETVTTHRVEITATNSAGWVTKTFTIAVTDVFEAVAPTDIALSATAVPEDAQIGSIIATISSDGSAPVVFSITADPDGRFAVSGDQLLLDAALDYETAPAHQVKITASNAAGSVSEVFTIAVTDVDEADAPTDIALSATSAPEDAQVGSVIATISANGTAPVTFSKVSDPDGRFAVSGTELLLAAALDYETATAHQVTLRATNAAGAYDETFTIAVTDVVEDPLSNPIGTALGATAAIGRVTTAQPGGTLHWVVTASPTTPSAAQIAAGQDHAGALAPDAGSQAVAAAGAQFLDPIPTGLSPSATHYLHFMHDSGGQSAPVSTAGFTTGALSTVFPEPGADTVGTRIQSNTTSHAINMPGGVQAGDVIGVFIRFAALTSMGTLPAGWEQAININNGEAYVFTKVAGSGEPSSYAFPTTVATRSLAIAFRASKAVLPGAIVRPADIQDADPPALTPPWGSRKTLWVALTSARGAGGYDWTAAPADYANFFAYEHTSGTGTTYQGMAYATRQLEAASENPGPFTISGSFASNSNPRAATLAFRSLDLPSGISLSATSVQDGSAAGALVGKLYSDGEGTITYSIVADPDGKFTILGNELQLAATVQAGTASSHTVKIRAENTSGFFEKQFTIGVGGAGGGAGGDAGSGVAPTTVPPTSIALSAVSGPEGAQPGSTIATISSDIALSAVSVPESAQPGAVVATISADGTAPVAFSKVSDPDDKFTVSGTELLLAAVLDYETATAHQVTLRATNAAGAYDETFTIAVADVVEAVAPRNIALDRNASVISGAVSGTIIGLLSASGDGPITFTEVSDPDNKFSVVDGVLRLSAAVNHATKSSHNVTVRATNAAGATDRTFTIAVVESTEAGTTLFSANWDAGVKTPDLGALTPWYGSILSDHTLSRGGLRGTATDSGFTFDLGQYGSDGYNGTLRGTFLRWDGSSGLSSSARLLFRWADSANLLTLDALNGTEKYIRVRKKVNNVYTTIASLTNAQVAALFSAFTWGSDQSMSSDLGVRIVMQGDNIAVYLKDVANNEEKPAFSFTVSEPALLTAPRHGFTIQNPAIVDSVKWATTPVAADITGLSSTTIRDDLPVDGTVAVIQYVGRPTPVFSITSDPDNKFKIVDDRLVLKNTVNAATKGSHSVTIQGANSAATDSLSATITVTAAAPAPSPGGDVTSIKMGNVTFSWSTPTKAGLDPTGRAWVLEPSGGLKGVQVSPARSTQNGLIINGLMLNMARTGSGASHPQAFDERLVHWDATKEVSSTIGQVTLRAGDKLLKAISETSITTITRRGSASEYACLHVVSSPPPSSQHVLRSTITWPGRNDPSNWYSVNMSSFLANRPKRNVPVTWRSFVELEGTVLRYNPVFATCTSDGSNGYELRFPFCWGQPLGGSSVNANYGEWCASRINDCALALCSSGGYTTQQIETIAWSMLCLGIESADPLQGVRGNNMARGAHLQWHLFPVAMALNLTGRASAMNDAFRAGGFIPGNVLQCFQITQAMHNAGNFQPHDDNNNKPGGWRRRTLEDQSGLAANQVRVPKYNSYEKSNRGTKWTVGMTMKAHNRSASAGISSMGNTDGTSPWIITLTSNSPFVAGDVIYVDCPPEWIAVGKYDWGETGAVSTFTKYSPSRTTAYRGQQIWGTQMMALYDCGFYEPILQPAMGYMKRAETSNEPTSSNDYQNVIPSNSAAQYYRNNYWSWPF